MSTDALRARRALLAAGCALTLMAGEIVHAELIPPDSASNPSASLLQFGGGSAGNAADLDALNQATGVMALNAIRGGRWSLACSMATRILATQVADVDALGVFALCAALGDDRAAVSISLTRLAEVEAKPGYYGFLTKGIVALREPAPDKAEVAFKTALQARPGEPLALFFRGEALHAQHKDAEAIATFQAVSRAWPDHSPALSAAARLMAAPKASQETLNEALALSERAVRIDPSNTAYWRLLADLYRRTGQTDRANAIAVQWLSGPPRLK